VHVERGPTFRWLNSPPAVALGQLSYSLYVWQQLFLFDAGWTMPWGAFVPGFPGNVLLALGAAGASYVLIEAPVLALRDGNTSRPARAGAITAPS
jgi:peptidoglycan/LPS O-acetylase OafA/YrhL